MVIIELLELNTLKSRFFANISHEFRTPLTLIMGQIDRELATPDEKKDRNRLEMVSRNAQQLLSGHQEPGQIVHVALDRTSFHYSGNLPVHLRRWLHRRKSNCGSTVPRMRWFSFMNRKKSKRLCITCFRMPSSLRRRTGRF